MARNAKTTNRPTNRHKPVAHIRPLMHGLRHNVRPVILILLVPLCIGSLVLAAIASGIYARDLASLGSRRLETSGWQQAQSSLLQVQPRYERAAAYYKLEPGQTLESVADAYGVDKTTLANMNPGAAVAGTTIKVPVLDHALREAPAAAGSLSTLTVNETAGVVHVANSFSLREPIVTTLPALAQKLQPTGAISMVSPGVYRIAKPLSVEGDIRLDITSPGVTQVQLESSATVKTCLCFKNATVLIKNVSVASFDPSTGTYDTNYADGRSYVRMQDGRMDIIDSKLSFLGAAPVKAAPNQPTSFQDEGSRGVTWRTSDSNIGEELSTGWVENSTFDRNYAGAAALGTSGMAWHNNHFDFSATDGLDLYKQSNSNDVARNSFVHNGDQGVSIDSHSNHNSLTSNTASHNKTAGFMFYDSSNYNIASSNEAYANEDNYVIQGSQFVTLERNTGVNPHNNNVRLEDHSADNYVIGNTLYGGKRAVHLLDGPSGSYVADNRIHMARKALQTDNAVNTLFVDNTVDNLSYDINANDRVVFGPNGVKPEKKLPADIAAKLQ